MEEYSYTHQVLEAVGLLPENIEKEPHAIF